MCEICRDIKLTEFKALQILERGKVNPDDALSRSNRSLQYVPVLFCGWVMDKVRTDWRRPAAPVDGFTSWVSAGRTKFLCESHTGSVISLTGSEKVQASWITSFWLVPVVKRWIIWTDVTPSCSLHDGLLTYIKLLIIRKVVTKLFSFQ